MTSQASTLDASPVGLGRKTWAHLHLPRLRAGELECISVKVPGERIAYVDAVELLDVTFYVSEAGRQRCLTEGVRNVHAWVVGTSTELCDDTLARALFYRRALYCPFKGGAFVDADTLRPIYEAERARLVGKEVWYF